MVFPAASAGRAIAGRLPGVLRGLRAVRVMSPHLRRLRTPPYNVALLCLVFVALVIGLVARGLMANQTRDVVALVPVIPSQGESPASLTVATSGVAANASGASVTPSPQVSASGGRGAGGSPTRAAKRSGSSPVSGPAAAADPSIAGGGSSTAGVIGTGTGAKVKAAGFSAGDLTELSTSEIDSRVSDMAGTGAGWVRLDLNWRFAQAAGPGSYDWSSHDRAVQAIRRHGMNALMVLDYAPRWASIGGCSGLTCAPRDDSEFATFAAAAVRHFAPLGVRDWEIWNEPNLPAYWSPAPDPARYAALLRSATPAIHAADPGATVVTGGLGVTYSSGSKISPAQFLSSVYANGGGGYFDAVGVHAYSFPAPPSHDEDWTGWTQMREVRSVMVARGDSAKRVWITEYGAPTGGQRAEATSQNKNYAADPDHVSEEYQAELAKEAIATASGYTWTGPIFWYGYKDLGTSSNSNESFFGLVRKDGSRKPAYDAYVSAVARSPKLTALATGT